MEYYDSYFHPFEGYSRREREELRERLLLEDKKNGKYEEFREQAEERYAEQIGMDETDEERERIKRKVDKLHAIFRVVQFILGSLYS